MNDLSNLENGFGGQYNPKLFSVAHPYVPNSGMAQRQLSLKQSEHFVYRDKSNGKRSGNTFYLYQGFSFKDEFKLIMMAKHFPKEKEVRIYSLNDLKSEVGKQGLMTQHSAVLKANSMRVPKASYVDFDFENAHFAKVEIVGPKESRQFVMKSRYCQSCSIEGNFFCRSDRPQHFEQELGSFTIKR